ncbi:MAG: RNA 2',3'-cyclic phosphodiesterase [Chloroflexi bacterium]|nr:RNA 2',3'-cyclic phosphodiesterase [Chloroflexota bacterium]
MRTEDSDKIRAFVAVEMPEEAVAHLAGVVRRLQDAKLSGVRTSSPAGIHLTLKFLGDISGQQLGPIENALRAALKDHGPFRLTLGEPGVFPNANRPRVLWVGVNGDVGALEAVAGAVEEALEPLGFPRDKRGFNAHLTVARIRDGTPARDRQQAAKALHAKAEDSIVEIEVNAVSLMRSTLRPTGATYDCLVSFPLVEGYRKVRKS